MVIKYLYVSTELDEGLEEEIIAVSDKFPLAQLYGRTPELSNWVWVNTIEKPEGGFITTNTTLLSQEDLLIYNFSPDVVDMTRPIGDPWQSEPLAEVLESDGMTKPAPPPKPVEVDIPWWVIMGVGIVLLLALN